ncbi:transposase [Lacticaseibacillus suibinensis]|uniref:transposase n=1 Tax=Lacticaseibacillus suibinensis TaxID=2486011 RepID=UPI000F767C0B|nr:transposase [Lacticaseibacillus suibinensis]
MMYEIAEQCGFKIDHMEIGKDEHIHLLVRELPKTSVTKIVCRPKAISPHRRFAQGSALQKSCW